MSRSFARIAVALALAFGLTTLANATSIIDLGTAAPPTSLFGIALTPFSADPGAIGSFETSVPSPLGSVGFTSSQHEVIDLPVWKTWSNGYTGDVYWRHGDYHLSATLTLPLGTTAFYFYVEPQDWVTAGFKITSGGESLSALSVAGFHGANGFGIYDPAGISSITIHEIGHSEGFGFGEFGIGNASAVPEPTTLMLLGAGLAGLGLRGRRK